MAPEVLQRLVDDSGHHATLGGESQDVTMLFADIRGFTRFAERHEPEAVVAILNQALSELIKPLRSYGGILDKYIGDGFLAFFEPAPDLSSAARAAVEAARMMQRSFRDLWQQSPDDELRSLGLGIGISSGRVVVGNVGSEDAMDYTVIGDAVNVAARLQSLAEDGEILVSQSTYEMLAELPGTEILTMIRLRGREALLNVARFRVEKPAL